MNDVRPDRPGEISALHAWASAREKAERHAGYSLGVLEIEASVDVGTAFAQASQRHSLLRRLADLRGEERLVDRVALHSFMFHAQRFHVRRALQEWITP